MAIMRNELAKMSAANLRSLRAQATKDCELAQAQLTEFDEAPAGFEAQIEQLNKLMFESCGNAQEADMELDRRAKATAAAAAKSARGQMAAGQKKAAEKDAAPAAPPVGRPETMSIAWWLAGGAAAIGATVLTVLGLRRQPTVVRYVKGLPKKVKALPKKMKTAVRNR